MRICFIGPATSAHIIKWTKWFSDHGNEVHIVSFDDGDISGAKVHSLSTGLKGNESDLAKIKYLFQGKRIKQIVENIKPDIINVHYASSYGTAVALSGLKDYILSVWGSDVYDFPNKSPFHKAMLKYSLSKAKYLFSTSQAMADETHKYTNKVIEITPFGVDVDLFNPNKRHREHFVEDFVVGTVKTLKPKYGIDYLLKAVAIVKEQEPEIPITVRIAGSGPNETEYIQLAEKLKVDVEWLGFISQDRAAEEWANMDVAIVPSTLDSESFGVSAVEAESSGVPVIVSDVPGLMEATNPGVTSIVVPRKNEEELAKAIIRLYKDPELRVRMGAEGRKLVLERYSIDGCFNNVNSIYSRIGGGY